MDHLNTGLTHFASAAELGRLHRADIRERVGRPRRARRARLGRRGS
jgi:hypothetical protein